MAILDEHEEEEVNASASEIKLKKKWPYGTFLNVQLCGSSWPRWSFWKKSRTLIIPKLYERNEILWKEFHEICQCLHEISLKVQTQELKFRGSEVSLDFNLKKCNFEWQKIANESMDQNGPLDSMFLFEDREYEKLLMTNQVSINSHIFENWHPSWVFGSHDLKTFSE